MARPTRAATAWLQDIEGAGEETLFGSSLRLSPGHPLPRRRYGRMVLRALVERRWMELLHIRITVVDPYGEPVLQVVGE